MSRHVDLSPVLQRKNFRLVNCPTGVISLAPWVSLDNDETYLHPLYQSRPLIDRSSAQLSIPTDWAGGYWDKRQGRVPTQADVQAALESQGEGATLGGSASFYPAHWTLRVLAHHTLLCPTIHPVNAVHVPILERVTDFTPPLAILLSRIQTMVPFLHWSVAGQDALDPYGKERFDGHLLPPFVWQSRITCSSCVSAERPCYHVSTDAPTSHGIPLRCASCVLDDVPCLFTVTTTTLRSTSAAQQHASTSTRQERSYPSPIQARFLPHFAASKRDTLDPATIWFQDMPTSAPDGNTGVLGDDEPATQLLSIGGLYVRGRTEVESGKRKSSEEDTAASKQRRVAASTVEGKLDRLRDKWGVLPDDPLDLLLRRQQLLAPAASPTTSTSCSHLPEVHVRVPLFAAGSTRQILDDLPGPGSALVADLAIITIAPSPTRSDEPPHLEIVLRGTHCSASAVQTAFPRGLACRSAMSTTTFDLETQHRKPQDILRRWRSAPSSSSLQALAGHPEIADAGFGWDDARPDELALDLLVEDDYVRDHNFKEVWTAAQRALGPWLQLPDTAISLRVPSPVDVLAMGTQSSTSPAGSELFSNLLLGLPPTSLTPPDFLDWLPGSDAPTSTTLACYIHRLSLGVPSPRPNFDCKVIRSCLDGADHLKLDEEWMEDGLKPSCQLLMGWMRRVDDESDCSRVAWSAYLREGSVTVYDGLLMEAGVSGHSLSDRQAFYTKSVNLLLRRLNQKPVSRVRIEQEVITTISPLATLPLTAHTLHILAHDPFPHRHGLDAYSISDQPSPPTDLCPISLDAEWLSQLRTGQVRFLQQCVSVETMRAVSTARKRMFGRHASG